MNTKHLKAKILDLAIRGKLVSQDSSEGNAADLLQKIREEKSELVKQKKIKEDKNASFIIKADDGKHYEQFTDGSLKDVEDEIPFEIPENWCWCRLKEISIISTGSTPLKSNKKYYENGTIPFITSADTSKTFVNKAQFFITQLALEENHLEINPIGSLIVAMYGEGKTRGQITELSIPATTNQACAVIKVIDDNEIIRAFVKNFFFYNYENIRRQAKGGNQANLNLTNIGNIYLPLPPLSEQKRIVSAIEKAFEQIDIIEKNKLSLKTYIKQTKSKVLDLAIHGKLVEQNPQEGNAFELLEKIRNDRTVAGACGSTELIKQKKIKEETKTAKSAASFIIKAEDGKHYEQLSDGSLKDVEEEIPFEIPENWCWCRLGEVCNFINGFAFDSKNFSDTGNTTVIRISDINKEKVFLDKCKKSKEIIEDNSFLVEYGDLLIAMSGATTGKNGIYMAHEKAYINQRVGNIKIVDKSVMCNEYRNLYIQAMQKVILEAAYGGAQPNISGNDICEMYLPLPPLSEQKRIVAKIEQVFEQLDVLEKSLGE